MTVFVVAAVMMTAIAVLLLVRPLLTRRASHDIERAGSNLAILRDQLAELEADLRAGTLDEAQYRESKAELERRVLAEVKAERDASRDAGETPVSGQVASDRARSRVAISEKTPSRGDLLSDRADTGDRAAARVSASGALPSHVDASSSRRGARGHAASRSRASTASAARADSLAGVPRVGVRTAIVSALVLPFAAAALYWQLGNRDAFDPEKVTMVRGQAGGEHEKITPQQLQEMVGRLAQRLEQEPENAEGWSVLARSYYLMQRFPESAAAYERLAKLAPRNADVLADYADALAMAQGRNLAGRPLEIVQQALGLDPNHWKALALAGTAAYDRKDYRAAVDYWERLLAALPADVPMRESIAASIAEARERGGLKRGGDSLARGPGADNAGAARAPRESVDPGAGAATPRAPGDGAGATPTQRPPSDGTGAAITQRPPGDGTSGTTAQRPSSDSGAAGATPQPPGRSSLASAAKIAGTVTLAPGLAAQAEPSDTVFIFARAAEGPRMPLAVLRRQVKDLPAAFSLDDSMAMNSGMKISSFPRVVVGARVSKAANATPQPGDLEGQSQPVTVGASNVAVVIDKVVR